MIVRYKRIVPSNLLLMNLYWYSIQAYGFICKLHRRKYQQIEEISQRSTSNRHFAFIGWSATFICTQNSVLEIEQSFQCVNIFSFKWGVNMIAAVWVLHTYPWHFTWIQCSLLPPYVQLIEMSFVVYVLNTCSLTRFTRFSHHTRHHGDAFCFRVL